MNTFNITQLHAHAIKCHDTILDNIPHWIDYKVQTVIINIGVNILLDNLLNDFFFSEEFIVW